MCSRVGSAQSCSSPGEAYRAFRACYVSVSVIARFAHDSRATPVIVCWQRCAWRVGWVDNPRRAEHETSERRWWRQTAVRDSSSGGHSHRLGTERGCNSLRSDLNDSALLNFCFGLSIRNCDWAVDRLGVSIENCGRANFRCGFGHGDECSGFCWPQLCHGHREVACSCCRL
jgi:hypothetical protein